MKPQPIASKNRDRNLSPFLMGGILGVVFSGFALADPGIKKPKTETQSSEMNAELSRGHVHDLRIQAKKILSFTDDTNVTSPAVTPDPVQNMSDLELLAECQAIYAQKAIDTASKVNDLTQWHTNDLERLGDGCSYSPANTSHFATFRPPPPYDNCHGTYSLSGLNLPESMIDFSGFSEEDRVFLNECLLIYQRRVRNTLDEKSSFQVFADWGCHVKVDQANQEASIYPPADYQNCDPNLESISIEAFEAHKRDDFEVVLSAINLTVLEKEMQSFVIDFPPDMQGKIFKLLEPFRSTSDKIQAACESFKLFNSEAYSDFDNSDIPPLLELLFHVATRKDEDCPL